MTTKSARVLFGATLLAGSAMAALLATPAAAAPTMSISVGNDLGDAQKAAQKKDFAAAAKAVASAKANAKTDFDNYMIDRVAISVAFNNNDVPAAAQAAQDAADSPAQVDADKFNNLKTALELETLVKNYPNAMKDAKAIEPLKEAATDPQIPGLVSQAYYFGGDFASAKAAAQKAIDAETKAGKAPDRQTLQVLLSADVGLKDEVGAESVLEQEVAAYNDPNDWAQMIDVAITTNGIRDVEAIWLGRLLFLVNAPVSKTDADMIGAIAGHLTFFGDAVNAKNHGGTIDPDPAPRADADKKTIAQQIAAEGAQNGTYSAKLAEALYSYGMYPEAETAAKNAIAKGGNPDTSEAPMVLGQAQAAQGHYDDAIATFGTVTGGGPATQRIVRLWTDFVKVKKNPPAAAAAPATAAAK
jgi:tetratricopeptide (TPR) repeat protein